MSHSLIASKAQSGGAAEYLYIIIKLIVLFTLLLQRVLNYKQQVLDCLWYYRVYE